MKFLEINLLAYGHFTNRPLAFPSGGPNLHIIYGRNEAGKSTFLRAITGVLYDIEVQTRDDFIHAKPDLRIGARLQHSSGAERAFVRKKGKPGTTLLDTSGRPMDESQLKSWLSIPDADLFRQMFGLSHEQLRAAGRALADAEDDAGRMLFGAALDGTALQQTLERMGTEAKDAFSALREALKKFHEKRKAASDAALPIKVWLDLNTDIEKARTDVQSSAERLRNSTAENARLHRIQKVLPLLTKRTELLQQRSALGDVRILAPDVSTTRKGMLQERDQTIVPEIERVQNRIEELRREHDELVIPKDLLAESVRIRKLSDQLGQYRKERADLPGVSRSIIELESQVKKALSDLGLGSLPLPEIPSVRLDEAGRKRIQELDRSRTRAESGLQQVRKQLNEKRVRQKQGEAKLVALPLPPDVNLLKTAWDRLPDKVIDQKLRRAAATVRELNAQVERACLATQPFPIDSARAPAIAVPTEEVIQRFIENEKDDQKERQDLNVRTREAEEAIEKAERELRKLSRADAPSFRDLDAARERRQQGWENILKAWKKQAAPTVVVEGYASGQPLADAYAAAVQSADDVADRLRREADAATRAERFREEREQALKRKADAAKAITALDADESRRGQEWNRLWAAAGIEPTAPREMAAWRKRFETLQDAVRRYEEGRREHDEIQKALDDQRHSLESALFAAKLAVATDISWPELCNQVQQLIGRSESAADEIARLRAEQDAIERDVLSLEEQERTDQEALATLDSAWSEAVGRIRLGPQASGAEANIVLDGLTNLFTAEEKRQPQDARRRAIYKQQAQFEANVIGLAERLAPDLLPPGDRMAQALMEWHAASPQNGANSRRLDDNEKDAVEKLAQTLIDRHAIGERDAATQVRISEDLRKASIEMNKREEQLKGVSRRIEALLLETGCDSMEALIQAERRSDEARMIENDLRQIHEKILIAGDGKTIQELEKAAEDADPDQIVAKVQEAAMAHSVLEREYQDALTGLGAQQQRIRGQDGRSDAARFAGEAQECLATARAHAARHARLQVGALVLQRAVDTYRRKNESAILRRAESLFQRLTLGRYTDLRVEYEGGKAKLRAVRPGEEVDVARSLSDGTLDQLFLSLRLASIEQHLASQEAMPLVLDDIFINFDDDRTRAGIEVLAEFAQKTQVLLLTHHARTLELAKKTLMESAWMEHRLDPAHIAQARERSDQRTPA